jgi:hypothetical protein
MLGWEKGGHSAFSKRKPKSAMSPIVFGTGFARVHHPG